MQKFGLQVGLHVNLRSSGCALEDSFMCLL